MTISPSKFPTRWETVPFGAVHSFNKGISITKGELVDSGIRIINYGQIHAKNNLGVTTTPELIRYAPAGFDLGGVRPLKQGDLVFADTSEDRIGVGAFLRFDRDEEVYPGYHTLVARPHDRFRHKYFSYLYLSDAWRDQIQRSAMGVKVFSINQPLIKQAVILVPPRTLQQRIVRFLDAETAKIDHLIAKQRQLFALLDLRNEARWHAAFVEFTPVKTRPLKRLLVKQYRPVLKGSGVVTAFRDGEVTLRSNRREEGFTFSETEAGYQGVAAGDLVFHGLDGFAGAVGISDSDGQSTPVYHVCRPRDSEDDLRFIAYSLRYLGHSGFLATQASSVRQRAVDFRNWQTFGQIPLSLPEGKEQQRIVAELDASAAALADAKATIERAVGLLQERRSALITAAVTGQIEV
ncbi:restriction endonuclease subunit S [Corynebacterium meridianum]|uniref:Restriction endonuclease subunit S n=1 Tax=Corynebacterium meridianum TaxID=2765363 RepID=A0A934HZ64_9CORY|nr:restriction endonuclease subunit S [Corynebacterium meridianum]MBI8989638.1 restriction endonuclease subunit S [Corynebacterium meridianum]